jgi:hypothetical protein
VNPDSQTPTAPYLTWETAARTLQDGVDSAEAGDTVLVTNGVYNTGGRAVYGTLNNRVVIDKAITVRSVNGPGTTVISGADRTRCAYVGSNAVVSGFTLTGGFTLENGDPIAERSGAGAWLQISGLLTNCIIFHNQAFLEGGGVYGGTLQHCIITNNQVYLLFGTGQGGGVARSTLYDCTVNGNYVGFGGGGGAFESTLYDCRVEGNSAGYFGGGAAGSTLYRCSVSGNSVLGYTQSTEGGGTAGCDLYDCVVTGNAVQSPEPDGGGSGGGAAGGRLYRCTVSGNSVQAREVAAGGGVAGAILDSSILSSNSVSARNERAVGGGANSSTLRNCLLFGNQAIGKETTYGGEYALALGGGANFCTLVICTVTGNSTTTSPDPTFDAQGGGVAGSTLQNCIVFNNTAPTNSEYALSASAGLNSTFSYSCTTPLPGANAGNITNVPGFVNPAMGNYHLMSGSPCIDAGTNLSSVITNDLEGNPRPLDGNGDGVLAFDMGAYEFDLRTVVPTNWFFRYGLDPTDPYVVGADPDQDAYTSYQEWVADTNPTNAHSFFQIEAIAASSTVNVYFQSSSNRLYTLRSATNLIPAVWADVPGQVDVPGSGGMDTLTDAANGVNKFYRISVSAP